MRRRPGPRAPAAAIAAAAALVCLLAPGTTRGSGINPIPPNSSSPDAQVALRATLPSENAYSETVSGVQTGSPATTSCGGSCVALGVLNEDITNASVALGTGAAFVSAFTGVSFTSGCPGGCPPLFLTCDGVSFGATLFVARGCTHLLMDFQGAHAGAAPTLTVQRQQEWTIAQGQAWVGSSTGGSLSASVNVWPASTYGSLAATKLTSWTVLQMSWAVPLPAGSWSSSGTTIEFLNTSTQLSSSQFSVQPGWILVQWTFLPTSQCLACEPVGISHVETLSYLFDIEGSGPIHGGGGILPPANGGANISIPTVPNSIQFNVVVNLPLANISSVGGGNYTARLEWHNYLPRLVIGPFYVISSLFAGSSNISITANGFPIGPAGFGTSNGSLQIYPGEVSVPNGSNLQLIVGFHYNTTFDPRAVLGYIDGFPITAGYVVGLGAFAGAGLLSVAEFNSPAVKRSRLTGSAEGLVLLAGLVIVWMGAF